MKKLDNETSCQMPPEKISHILSFVPEEKKLEVQNTLEELYGEMIYMERTSIHVGPLPDPQTLREYKNIIPSSPERILASFEEESQFQRNFKTSLQKDELKIITRGQWFGFISGILAVIGTIIMALTGHDTVASVFGTTTIIGLVTAFLIGSRKDSKD